MRIRAETLYRRLAATRRRVAALLLLTAAIGCAGPPALPPSTDVAGRRPDLAVVGDNRLVVRYPGTPAIVLVAEWPVDDPGAPASRYRAARLEVLSTPLDVEAFARAGRSASLLPRPEWDRLVRDLMLQLAPIAPHEAALAVIQGTDVVFTRDSGSLRVFRLDRKPAALTVTRVVTEEELTRRASALLAERFGDRALLLFDTGEGTVGRSFVLIDAARQQSVLIAPASAPASLTEPADAGFALSMTDALVIRSHLITPLTQPFTAATRLTWLTLQTAVGLVPKPRPAPLALPPADERPAMDLTAFERSLDERFGAGRTTAVLTLLIDGDRYFPRLVQAIQDSLESVQVRLYIFDTDPYALQLADLLKERSRSISVEVLLDQFGTLTAGRLPGKLPYAGGVEASPRHSIVAYLRADSRVQVRTLANPWLTSDHTKTVIIDGRRAFLGGMNIGQEYRYEWHDMMVEAEGPIAARLTADFADAWAQAAFGGDLARLAQAGEARPAGGEAPPGAVPVRILTTRTGRPEILAAQLEAIRASRGYIYVEQPYVSDDEIISALVDARRRGVDVRVVLPTAGDSGLMNAANLVATNVFVRNGVRVYAYPGMTHVKAAIYDGWACVGSANFDKLSLRINRELDVATSDPQFVGRLRRELFERDFALSTEINEPRPVGWSAYLSSFIANQF